MITVTDNAKQFLKELLLAQTDDPDFGLRLTLEPQSKQFGLTLGKEAQGDQVVEHDGSKVLLVGHELGTIIEGVTIDTRDTADGPKLVIFKE